MLLPLKPHTEKLMLIFDEDVDNLGLLIRLKTSKDFDDKDLIYLLVNDPRLNNNTTHHLPKLLPNTSDSRHVNAGSPKLYYQLTAD